MSYLKFETLPEGVWPIKFYGSLGATLVECEHARRADVRLVRNQRTIFQMCPVCKSTRFDRPVKLLAIVPDVPAQRSLF